MRDELPRVIVEEPEGPSGQCWCKPRLYGVCNFVPGTQAGYGRCSKRRRSGFLTCWWHRKYESRARALRNRSAGRV